MAVDSVSSTTQNSNIFLQQQQARSARDLENDKDKDDVATKSVAEKVDIQKAVSQQVVVEKSEAQKVDAKKAEEKTPVVQTVARPSVNTSGQVVGSIIDTQA